MGAIGKYFSELRTGLTSYLDAHKVIVKHKMWGYFVIPAIITAVYSGLYWFLVYRIHGSMLAEAESTTGWWSEWSLWIANAVFWPGVVWFFFASFKYVILILLSPMLTNLSEKIDRLEMGFTAPKGSLSTYLQDMKRALSLSLRNFKYEFLICLPLGFIPYAGVVLVFFVTAFYAGFGYMDYTLERRRYSMEESIKFMHEHRGLTLGLGLIFQMGMLVPLAGWLIIPTYATAASTLTTGPLAPYKPVATQSSNQ